MSHPLDDSLFNVLSADSTVSTIFCRRIWPVFLLTEDDTPEGSWLMWRVEATDIPDDHHANDGLTEIVVWIEVLTPESDSCRNATNPSELPDADPRPNSLTESSEAEP